MSAPVPIVALLVEDNPDDQWFAQRAFRKHAPTVLLVLAEDGVAALETIRAASGPKPDFVLLDMNLPRMGGREVLRALREDPATGALPVVAFTTDDDDPDEFAGDDRTACLRKPLDFARLRGALAAMGLKSTAVDFGRA